MAAHSVSIANFRTLVKRITPTLDTSAYGAGDTLFDRTAIAIDAGGKPCKGTIRYVGVQDKDDQTAQTITLWFLRSNVVFGTPNSAPGISDADGQEIVGKVSVATSDDLGAFKYGQADGLLLPFELDGGTLYVAATTAGTPTHSDSGLYIRIGMEIETTI